MKIINEKGKLFGIINIVDLLVLLAVIAVVVGVGYKLFGSKVAEVVSPEVTLTTVVRVRGATPFLVKEVERNDQVGKKIVNGNEFLDAVVTAVDIEAYNQQIPTADGRIVTATDEDKRDIVFTIETKVRKGSASYKIGTQEVRAGRTFIVKTDDFESSGNIDMVDVAE